MTCTHCGQPAVPSVHQRTGGYCGSCAYLTIPETYAALRISRATYYRMVRAGTIHPRHISPGRVLVPRADVDAILGVSA
jgi:predicted DNA-binding transcriptional regulator AlpA